MYRSGREIKLHQTQDLQIIDDGSQAVHVKLYT